MTTSLSSSKVKSFGSKLLASATIALALVALSGVSAQASVSDNASILQGVNSYRASVGAPNVSEASNLDQLAQARADDAARANMIQHDANYWYNNLGPTVGAFGELLAQNQPASGVAGAWARSGSHYPIMVGAQYTKVGIGFAISPQGQNFAVLILTAPPATPALAPAPEAPQNVSASYAQGAVNVSWSASTSGSPTDYLAYLYRDGAQVATSYVSASNASTSFPGVELGKTYTVTVQSFRSTDGRASAESAPSAAVVAPARAANAPVAYPAYGSGSTLKFYWSTPEANGAEISGYRLRILRDGQQVEERALAATDYTYSPQVSGDYSFSVAAVNAVGVGAFASSQSASFSLPEVTPAAPSLPYAPTNLKLASRGGSVQASWSSPDASAVSSYVVSIYLNGELVRRIDTANTEISTALPASGSGALSFVVSAKNSAGLSASVDTSFSYANAPQLPPVAPVYVEAPKPAPAATTVTPAPVSALPAAIIVKPTPKVPATLAAPSLSAKAHGSVLVRWNATKVQGAQVAKYQVRIVSGAKAKVYSTGASARTLTVKGLQVQKVVKVSIRAYSAAGWGKYSALKSVKTKR